MPTAKAFTSGSEFPPLESGKLRLYSMRFCPFAQRARILLTHKGIDFEIVNINLKSKPEWFLEKTPLGTVPVIEKDDIIVYDSPIVCQYLDETYPGEKLTPADPYQRAKDAMLVELDTKKVITPFYKVRQSKSPEAVAELLTGLETLEKDLKSRATQFFGGDRLMMIDIMLWPHIELIHYLGQVNEALSLKPERFPLLCAWIDAMKAVPSVKENMCSEDLFAKLMVANLEGKEIYDLGLDD